VGSVSKGSGRVNAEYPRLGDTGIASGPLPPEFESHLLPHYGLKRVPNGCSSTGLWGDGTLRVGTRRSGAHAAMPRLGHAGTFAHAMASRDAWARSSSAPVKK